MSSTVQATSSEGAVMSVDIDLLGTFSSEGYATVMLAQNRLGTRLVVRAIGKREQISEAELQEIEDEWKLLKESLTCEHLIRGYHAFQTHNFLCMVVEYGGISVKEYRRALEPCTTFDTDVVRSVLVQSSQALSYLHDRDIVHRNVTHDHVLISNTCHVKLTHFRSACRLDSPKLLTPAGDDQFKALEAFEPENGKITPGSDYWSLGVVVYYMCHGHWPYRYNRNRQKLEMNMRSISINDATLPSTIKEVLIRLLEVDPFKRVSTFVELHEFSWLSDWKEHLHFRKSIAIEHEHKYHPFQAAQDVFAPAAHRCSEAYVAMANAFPMITVNAADPRHIKAGSSDEPNLTFETVEVEGISTHTHVKTHKISTSSKVQGTSKRRHSFRHEADEANVSKPTAEPATTPTRRHSVLGRILHRLDKNYAKFTVLYRLASGAFAEHYVVTGVQSESDYAMKLYPSDYSRAKVVREMQALLALRDVNQVVQLKTGYDMQEYYGIITVFYPGWQPLEQFRLQSEFLTEQSIKAIKSMSDSATRTGLQTAGEATWKQVLYQLLMLLAIMQERGVTHGCLSVEQIIIEPITHHIIVCGFSEARFREANTVSVTDKRAVQQILLRLFGSNDDQNMETAPDYFSLDLKCFYYMLSAEDLVDKAYIENHSYFRSTIRADSLRHLPSRKIVKPEQAQQYDLKLVKMVKPGV